LQFCPTHSLDKIKDKGKEYVFYSGSREGRIYNLYPIILKIMTVVGGEDIQHNVGCDIQTISNENNDDKNMAMTAILMEINRFSSLPLVKRLHRNPITQALKSK
jgi:hypothetical protein